VTTPTEERAWWDEMAHTPELEMNIYDHSLGTTEQCLLEIIPALTPFPEQANILDLGCGIGRLTFPMARALPDLTFVGLDISTAILAEARHKRGQLANVSLIAGDGRSLPAHLEVDAAFSMGLFQHLPPEACAGYVREVSRVLRLGGKFRFQDVIGTDDGFLSHQTSASEMQGWCHDAGLDVICTETSRLYPQWQWMTARKP
jgi:cyclopropane fatty-acyl-phospholipid synthase-like methyltransferase